MTNRNYSVTKNGRLPIFKWDKDNPFDETAIEQYEILSNCKAIEHHIAAMPDAHLGAEAPIGSVIATTTKILIPSAVGVDIGCGMIALQTSLKANELPDSLKKLREAIENSIPVGTPDKTNQTRGTRTFGCLCDINCDLFEKSPFPRINVDTVRRQLGTLGGGNHFIEMCLDKDEYVWMMLHSGSRGVGNKVGSYYINEAKNYLARNMIDSDVGYVVDDPYNKGNGLFNQYKEAMLWCQEYAKLNRQLMMSEILRILRRELPEFTNQREAINCHHNYAEIENHFGKNFWITRKGAVRAREGDLGIIPGSMGTSSFIVKGKGNKDSYCSCSHGAGRSMSRKKARMTISFEEHKEKMKGIEASLNKDFIDESPRAYKDIHKIMEAQKDLVSIEAELTPILNIKG